MTLTAKTGAFPKRKVIRAPGSGPKRRANPMDEHILASSELTSRTRTDKYGGDGLVFEFADQAEATKHQAMARNAAQYLGFGLDTTVDGKTLWIRARELRPRKAKVD